MIFKRKNKKEFKMRKIKQAMVEEEEEQLKTALANWELRLLIILIILLVMLTILRLNLPYTQVFKFIPF